MRLAQYAMYINYVGNLDGKSYLVLASDKTLGEPVSVPATHDSSPVRIPACCSWCPVYDNSYYPLVGPVSGTYAPALAPPPPHPSDLSAGTWLPQQGTPQTGKKTLQHGRQCVYCMTTRHPTDSKAWLWPAQQLFDVIVSYQTSTSDTVYTV